MARKQPDARHAERRSALPDEGRARAVIENISPSVDEGRFAAKRVVGDRVEVEADCFTDGHDVVACLVRYRHDSEPDWREAPMTPLGNDRWRGAFDARSEEHTSELQSQSNL